MTNNPYFIDNINDPTKKYMTEAEALGYKKNNVYMMNICTKIVNVKANELNSILNKYCSRFLTGRLPYGDKNSKYNIQVGEKLKFILIQLLSNEKSREIILNSYFADLIKIYSRGYVYESSEYWLNYKVKQNASTEFKTRDPLNSAHLIYATEKEIPVGLNLGLILNSIVAVHESEEKFKIQEIDDIIEKDLMLQALSRQLDNYRTNPTFKANFDHIIVEDK